MGERVNVIGNYFVVVGAVVARLDTLDMSLLVKVLLAENVFCLYLTKFLLFNFVDDQNFQDA